MMWWTLCVPQDQYILKMHVKTVDMRVIDGWVKSVVLIGGCCSLAYSGPDVVDVVSRRISTS